MSERVQDFDANTKQRVKMRRWAWWRELRADMSGYFWTPCPICGTEFGGQEWHHGHLAKLDGSGTAICPACATEGRGDDFYYQPNGSKIRYIKNDEPDSTRPVVYVFWNGARK